MAKKKLTRKKAIAASEPAIGDIKKNASYFLSCLRRVSFFLNKNAHVLDLEEIQEDLSGLSNLSNTIEEIENKP